MQIIAKELKYSYNKKADFSKDALKGISLEINEGDFFGIIGETGSGKSTFVQHLNGLIPVQSGELTVGGITFKSGVKHKPSELKALRSKIGLIFQYPEYQLFAETVYEDVAFGLKNFYPEKDGKEVYLEVKRAIEEVGLDFEKVKDKTPFELSGGQKRRVAIAGVLVTKPEVLVLDEPVAGLDPQGKKNLMQLLHNIHKDYVKTIVVVSHDIDEVNENCNRVAVFNNGYVTAVDSTENIFSKESVLSESGLDLPITATLTNELKKIGVNLKTNYKTDDFINAVIKEYNK